MIQVATIPEVGDVETLQQTDATANSITMAWNAIAGATSYDVYRYNSWDNYVKVGENVTATSFTATGLGNSMAVSYFVIAKQATGVNGIIGQSKNFKRVDMYTIPGKINIFGLNNFWSNISVADFVWQRMNNVSGYEFELRNSSNKVLLKKDTGSSASAEVRPFKKGVFTKARVRAYITVGNKKLYGPWSDYKYNASNKSVKVIRSANRKKITVKWKKITGATGYKVSISTKSNSGFKKVKTVGKKKTSLTITKCGKKKLSKNKKYYIRVEYQTKVGKKTITSDIAGSGSI